MVLQVAPTQADIFTVLGDFLTQITGVPVAQGQVNRVAEPSALDFVVMWPINMRRLATNIDAYIDAVFTGSILGTTMTITAVDPDFIGKINVGSSVFGVNVTTGTAVTAFGTGTGGVGTYTVSLPQTVISETLATGTAQLLQKAEVVIQIDVHGPNAMANAQIVSTAFRDRYATSFFYEENQNVAPLYADDPKQVPFINAEQQYENRWVCEAHLQVNQTIVVPQQFFDEVTVGLISVEERYPPN